MIGLEKHFWCVLELPFYTGLYNSIGMAVLHRLLYNSFGKAENITKWSGTTSTKILYPRGSGWGIMISE